MLKMHKVDRNKANEDGVIIFNGFDMTQAEETLTFDWNEIIVEGIYGRSDTYYWTENGEVVFLINIFDYRHHSKGSINYIYINYAETNSKFKRKGYGRKCMKEFEEFSVKTLGVSCFILCTIDTDESRAFYDSLGYGPRSSWADPNERIKELL